MSNLKKYFVTSFTLLFAVASAYAVEINLSGSADADIGVYYDENFDYSTLTNHKIAVDLNAQINEGVSFDVSAKTFSTILDQDSNRVQSTFRSRENGAIINDSEGMFTGFELYSFSFNWNFTENGTLMFGDLIYGHGFTSYYALDAGTGSATILPYQHIRGIGIKASDLTVYFGSQVNSKDFGFSIYSSYAWNAINKDKQQLTLTPAVDFIFSGNDRFHRGTAGLEIDYSQTMENFIYGIYLAGGFLHHEEQKNAFTLLIEPSLNYKKFSLAFTGYHASLPYALTDKSVAEQAYMPVQQFFVLEPGIQFHRIFAMGFPMEYQNESIEKDDDELYRFGPNFYLYPTSNAEFIAWVAYDIVKHSPSKNLLSFGLKGSLGF